MAAGLPRIQFQTPLIHFANRNLFFQFISLLHLHFRSHPQSTAAAAGTQRRPQWAEPLRWRFLVSSQRQFHRSWWLPSTFSRVMRHGLYLATQREALCARAQSRDCSSHIPRLLVFVRVLMNVPSSRRLIPSIPSIDVEKVLFWLLHMERHSLVLVLSSEDLSYIRLCTFSIAIWWRLHIENFVEIQDSFWSTSEIALL